MPNTTAPTSESDLSNPLAAFWGLGNTLETQARLWNHLLDANRSLLQMYAPWIQWTPWAMNTAIAPLESEVAGEEPAETVDGIPDTLEAQARSWNRFLDANRSFWGAMTWTMPPGLMFGAPDGTDTAPASDEAEPRTPTPRADKSPTPKKASRARRTR